MVAVSPKSVMPPGVMGVFSLATLHPHFLSIRYLSLGNTGWGSKSPKGLFLGFKEYNHIEIIPPEMRFHMVQRRADLELRASQVALVIKNLPAKAWDVRHMGSIPGSGRSPGEGHGNPLQYSCLENPMDRGAWRATIHRVTKSQTQLKRLSTRAHASLRRPCQSIRAGYHLLLAPQRDIGASPHLLLLPFAQEATAESKDALSLAS